MENIFVYTVQGLKNSALTPNQQRYLTKDCLEMVWRMALGFQHVTDNSVDAEDLFQEGLIVLVQRCEGFRPVGNSTFCTYVHNFVLGAMRDFCYKYGNVVSIPEDEGDNYLQTKLDTDLKNGKFTHLTTEDDEQDEALQTRVRQMLDRLPPLERRIMLLYFGFEGGKEHTLTEIAKVMKLSRGRVNQLYLRALNIID